MATHPKTAQKPITATDVREAGERAKERIGYRERLAPGGGTPLGPGQKAPSKEWVERHRQPQPRNDDGTFGFNSDALMSRKYSYHGNGNGLPVAFKALKLRGWKKGQQIVINGKVIRTLNGVDYETCLEYFRNYDPKSGSYYRDEYEDPETSSEKGAKLQNEFGAPKGRPSKKREAFEGYVKEHPHAADKLDFIPFSKAYDEIMKKDGKNLKKYYPPKGKYTKKKK